MKSNNFFSKFFFPKIFLNFFFEKKYEKKKFQKRIFKKNFSIFFFEKKISKKKFPLKIIFPDIFPGKTFKIFYLPKRPFSDLVFFHFFAWLYIHSRLFLLLLNLYLLLFIQKYTPGSIVYFVLLLIKKYILGSNVYFVLFLIKEMVQCYMLSFFVIEYQVFLWYFALSHIYDRIASDLKVILSKLKSAVV